MFTLTDVPPGTHMCLIYDDERVRLDVMADFLSGCLRRGGRVGYFRQAGDMDALRKRILKRFPDVDAVLNGITVAPAREFYCPDDHFDKDHMLGILEEGCRALGTDTNLPVHHICGEMDWALDLTDGSASELPAYEHAVNRVCARRPLSAICQYDSRRFDPGLIFDIMNAHPFIVMEGVIVSNPGYEPVF